ELLANGILNMLTVGTTESPSSGKPRIIRFSLPIFEHIHHHRQTGGAKMRTRGRAIKDYLLNYTNAAFIVKEGFNLPEDGLFAGFDAAKTTYSKDSWNYEEGGKIESLKALAAAASNSTNAPSPGASDGKDLEKSGERGVLQAAGGPGASGQGGQKPPA